MTSTIAKALIKVITHKRKKKVKNCEELDEWETYPCSIIREPNEFMAST